MIAIQIFGIVQVYASGKQGILGNQPSKVYELEVTAAVGPMLLTAIPFLVAWRGSTPKEWVRLVAKPLTAPIKYNLSSRTLFSDQGCEELLRAFLVLVYGSLQLRATTAVLI